MSNNSYISTVDAFSPLDPYSSESDGEGEIVPVLTFEAFVEAVKQLKLPKPVPPVVEWGMLNGFSGDYNVSIIFKAGLSDPYYTQVFFKGKELSVWCDNGLRSARLAAENAILRHWAENLNN